MRAAPLWLASIALALILTLVAACGDDATNTGIGQVGDGVDGPDTAGGDSADDARDAAADGSSDVVRDAPGSDDGPKPVAECGDGVCQDSESVFTCRDDCKAPASLKCLAAGCKEALDACLELPTCQAAAECLLACEDQSCVATCRETAGGAAGFIFDGLAECGRTEECLRAEPDNGSCPGECGEFVDGADCQCEEDCAIFDDCCEDFETVCTDEPIPCVQEKCDEQLSACLGMSACAEALACAAACNGPQCTIGCVSELADEALNAFQRVRQCANDECGGGPGAECGNDVCEQGESAESCPADCSAGGPVCGDGECEIGENPNVCPADCGGGGGAVCGNDQCEEGESADSCPADCEGTPTGTLVECIMDECGAEFTACQSNSECSAAIDCLQDCPAEDQGCATGCATAGGFGSEAIGLALCVVGTTCLGGGGGPTCGDGTCDQGENAFSCPADCSGGGTCGDGSCGSGETAQSCPADCTGTVGGSAAECIEAACPSEYADCASNGECSAAIACLDGCDSGDQGCVSGCATAGGFGSQAIALGICAFNTPCVSGGGGGAVCGDGSCNGDENSQTCPGDCPGGGPECGDGICNGDETEASCGADCGGSGGGLLLCLATECEAELAACEALADCDETIPCLVQCVESGSSGCTQACGDALQFTEELGALGACGGQAGCGNPGG